MDVGQRRYLSAFEDIWKAEKIETGKPRSACSVAAVATSAKDIVPQRSSAVSHESGEAGTKAMCARCCRVSNRPASLP